MMDMELERRPAWCGIPVGAQGPGKEFEMSLRFGVEGHARRASPKPVGFSVMMLEKRRSCPSRKPVSSPATAKTTRVAMAARAVNPGAGDAGSLWGCTQGLTRKGANVAYTKPGTEAPAPTHCRQHSQTLTGGQPDEIDQKVNEGTTVSACYPAITPVAPCGCARGRNYKL
jgi:hypothetical protein